MRAGMSREIVHSNFSQCLTSNVYWAGGRGFEAPSLPIPRIELELRATKFKEESIKLLYELFDATKGVKNEWRARTRQIDYMAGLSTPELALLCVFVSIMGFNYNEKLASNFNNTAQESKEAVVVFEHNLIRHGPLYAWLHISPITKCNRVTLRGTIMLNDWFKEKQAEGLEKLKAYEAGHTTEARMTIVLWRIFQEREDVAKAWQVPRTGEGLWSIAKKLVEARMANYVLT